MLKPKVKAFGFNKKELQGVAAKIADNLNSEEDASEEDVNAEIEIAIEAVLPILELGQRYANRVINDSKRSNEDEENEDEEDVISSKSPKSTNTKTKKSEDDVPAWAQAIIDSNNRLKDELASIKGEKLADTRRGKLEKLLKDTGSLGTRILKSFNRMKFDNDDDFDEFYAEVQDDLKNYNQERANAGLEKLGAPSTGGTGKKEKKSEILSDEEVKALASL